MALRGGAIRFKFTLVSKQRSIVLTDPQAEWLSAEAVRLGITGSDVVRRIIDDARSLDTHRRKIGERLLPAEAFSDA